MNILTFDIEEWYIEKTYHGARKEKYTEFENYLHKILDVLDERNTKATFFCLGKMASEFPDIVKRIDSHGHEIGCHSDKHVWLTKLSKAEVIEDTHEAVDSLQQCVGKKIVSYRAPAFSIGETNKWIFEVLANCGIEYDSSVFPASRDFGGFPCFEQKIPSIISFEGITIKEFPIPIISLFCRQVAYSGGGYFRFFPLSIIQREMKKNDYSMFYLHIGDFLSETNSMLSKIDYETYFKEPGTLINRYKRYVKSNMGKKNAWNKLTTLIKTADFISLEDAGESINWENVPIVNL